MLHQELWQTDNEEWIKTRKQEWLLVKPLVEEVGIVASKHIKGLRHFFIYGELIDGFEFPRMNNYTGSDISLFFKFWFLPELTEDIIREEVDSACRNDVLNFTYDFFQLTASRNSSTETAGVMSGREKILCNCFYKASFEVFASFSELYFDKNDLMSYSRDFFGSFNSSIRGWFEAGYPVNNAYQWMIPVWKDCIQYLPARAYEPRNKGLRKLMKMLSPDYHQQHFDTDDRYQKVATELREYILSDESPEALKEVWREVHQG